MAASSRNVLEKSSRLLKAGARGVWRGLGWAWTALATGWRWMRLGLQWVWARMRRLLFGRPPGASLLAVLLHDRKANTELHQFLLGNIDKDEPGTITVGNVSYTVGIVSINPAPVIPAVRPQPEARA